LFDGKPRAGKNRFPWPEEWSLLDARAAVMKEILPGVFHWKTFHQGIQAYVHSYYCNAADPPLLIDPRFPVQGIEWFAARGAPRHIYLTNRHHYRHSDRFAARYGAQVWCHKDGLHEFSHGERVTGFSHGKQLPGGILALEVAALCPEENRALSAAARRHPEPRRRHCARAGQARLRAGRLHGRRPGRRQAWPAQSLAQASART